MVLENQEKTSLISLFLSIISKAFSYMNFTVFKKRGARIEAKRSAGNP